MPGTPPIIGAGVGPLGLGPRHEEVIRRASEDARRLELEEVYRPQMAYWERGEDEFDKELGLPPRQDITEIVKPLVTPGRQDPNETITPFRGPPLFPPRPPPYGQLHPPPRPPLGQPPQPAVVNPFLPRRPAPPQG